MIEGILALVLVALCIGLPIKWAYSLTIATSFSLFYYLISDVATLMFVILFIRTWVKYGINSAIKTPLFRNHFYLVLFGALTLIWATSFPMGLSIFIAEIKILLVAIVGLQLIQKRSDISYLVYGVTGGILYIVIALNGWKYGFFGISASQYQGNISEYGRLLIQYLFPERHTPINSNTWAALTSLSTGIIAVFYFYYSSINMRLKRWVVLGVIAFVLISTLDLASRTGLIGLLVVLIMAFYYQTPKSFYLKATLVLVLFFTGSLTVSLISELVPESSEVLQSRLAESEQEDPRVKIWRTGLSMGFSNITHGVGLGNASVEFKNYMTERLQSDKLTLHNSFITHFAELGIIGLILFLRLFYLWQKPQIFSKFAKALFVVVSFNILLNAMSHSFELTNYFIVIAYSTHKFFILEQQEVLYSKVSS